MTSPKTSSPKSSSPKSYRDIKVPCACGCGELLSLYTSSGGSLRKRRYIRGHQLRQGRGSRIQKDVLLQIETLQSCGTEVRRRVLDQHLPWSYQQVTDALKRLREKGRIESAGWGSWRLSTGEVEVKPRAYRRKGERE